MDALWERRALLVSGKGGVGKTTVAAALARAAVNAGKRVLLAEVELGGSETDSPSHRRSSWARAPPVPRSSPCPSACPSCACRPSRASASSSRTSSP
ncbi:ArsA-related P-loop ATPase [Cystobacter fuscus]